MPDHLGNIIDTLRNPFSDADWWAAFIVVQCISIIIAFLIGLAFFIGHLI